MDTQDIPLNNLSVSELNTRKDLAAGQEDSGVRELANAIQRQGLLQPLTVRPDGNGSFEVVSGQRRLQACKLIELDPVPCIVRADLTDADAVTVSLVENIHRADMAPLDKAKALKSLYGELGTQKRVSEETGWSTSTVGKYLKLLDLPEELQDRLSTSDGVAGVTSLSRLAREYEGNEAVEVYEKIAPFKQRIQQEIIRQSEGDSERVDALVAEAQEGIFDLRRCGGAYGCEIVKEIATGELSESAFQELVEASVGEIGTAALENQVRKSAREFWRSLALS